MLKIQRSANGQVVFKLSGRIEAENVKELRELLASPCRRVEFSDTELPKSGSGKILKRILRERFWAHEERAVGWERRMRFIALHSERPAHRALVGSLKLARAVVRAVIVLILSHGASLARAQSAPVSPDHLWHELGKRASKRKREMSSNQDSTLIRERPTPCRS